jgi:hypothetical protein
MRPRALPPLLHVVNEGGAFVLEVLAFATLGWWGATRATSFAFSVAQGAGAPLGAALVWGLFAAPRARVRLPMVGTFAVKVGVFGTASAALWTLGWPRAAAAFALLALGNTSLAALDRDAQVRAARNRSLRA